MTRPEEITYYADLIASLTISAARTSNPGHLRAIHKELPEAFADVFALIDQPPFELSEVLQRRAAS